MRNILYCLLLLMFGCSSIDPSIRDSISEITESNLHRHVEALTKDGPRFGEKRISETESYIKEQLINMGYEPIEEPYESRYGPSRNIYAEKTGSLHPDTIVEIGAHFDSVSRSPGADDNASGVAALLEVARTFTEWNPEKTIRFCFFAEEERGLLGSRYHAESILRKKENVEGILVFEMIGYSTDAPNSQHAPIRVPLIASLPKRGNFILVLGNIPSGGIGNHFENCADRYVPDLEYFSANRIGGFFADAARSDHYPYWKSGLRGVMLGDTANFRNPHYHRKTDTIETLNFPFMAQITRAATAMMLEWAEAKKKTDHHKATSVR